MIKTTNYPDDTKLDELIKILEKLDGTEYSHKSNFLNNHQDFTTITLTNGKGSVFLYDGRFILKVFSERALREGSVDNKFLLEIQDLDFPPKLYCYGDDFAVMENVAEPEVLNALKSIVATDGLAVAENVLDTILVDFEKAMKAMLERGILYSDMKLDTHFKWDNLNKRFRIIDFGNCIFLKNPKNPTEIDDLVRGRRIFLKNRLLELI